MLLYALYVYHCVNAFTVYSLQLPVSDEHINTLTHVSIILFVDVCYMIIYRHLDIATERIKALSTDKKSYIISIQPFVCPILHCVGYLLCLIWTEDLYTIRKAYCTLPILY